MILNQQNDNYLCTQGRVKIEDIAKFFLGGRALGKLDEIGAAKILWITS